MRISDWSSDVCSSDLKLSLSSVLTSTRASCRSKICAPRRKAPVRKLPAVMACVSTTGRPQRRSEEHTSELQSLMRISYAVFCLKKQTQNSKQRQNKHPRHSVKTRPNVAKPNLDTSQEKPDDSK